MIIRCLYEDRLPQKLSVLFSPKIAKQIKDGNYIPDGTKIWLLRKFSVYLQYNNLFIGNNS